MPANIPPLFLLRLAPLALVALIALVKARKSPRAVLGLGLWSVLAYGADLIAWRATVAPVTQIALPGAAPVADMAVTGFPIHFLHIPKPDAKTALAGEWWVVVLNLVFWVLLAWIIAAVIMRRRPARKDKEERAKGGAGLGWLLLLGGFACYAGTEALLRSWFA